MKVCINVSVYFLRNNSKVSVCLHVEADIWGQAPDLMCLQVQNESAVTSLPSLLPVSVFWWMIPNCLSQKLRHPISNFLNTSHTYSPLLNPTVTVLFTPSLAPFKNRNSHPTVSQSSWDPPQHTSPLLPRQTSHIITSHTKLRSVPGIPLLLLHSYESHMPSNHLYNPLGIL